jgi:phage terminase large subunit
MKFSATTATRKIICMDKRIRLVAGGTSASKTISILLYLISRAQQDTEPTLTSVVSESFPHLKRGSIRDFINIMQGHNYFDDTRWNKSESTYTFETGSRIEFFSADMPSKVRGPRRDRLFVNEANNVDKESWDQLLLRTREFAFADWNPVSDFYLYEDYGLQDELVPSTSDPDAQFLILTYKDNESLEAAIVKEIEKRQVNKQWFRVYGQGKRGEVEGKIFKGWKIIDEIPHEARLERRGLDFGYAQDPMALCDIYYYNGGYIIDELAYRKNMLNRQTADLILSQPDPNVLTIADSAEPKSISEMQEYGINIIGVQKVGREGMNFTNAAIQYVQGQQMSITRRSVNFRKSYNNFMWMTDKDGTVLPKYDHFWSDGMMSVVYGMDSLRPKKEKTTNTRTGNLASMWY